MECEKIQQLIYKALADGQKFEDDEHLKSCPDCAELVRDLQYIAEQAKLLLPLRDPNPKVWTNIEAALERENILRHTQGLDFSHAPIRSLSVKFWLQRLIFASSIITVILLLLVMVGSKPDNRVIEYFGLGLFLFLAGCLYLVRLADEFYYPLRRVNDFLTDEVHILENRLTHDLTTLLGTMIAREIKKIEFKHAFERDALLTRADRICRRVSSV